MTDQETAPRKVAVLASGSGSNLQALIDFSMSDNASYRIDLVVTNNADAFALERARRAGIATAYIDHRDYPDRPSFERVIHQRLVDADIQLVCLAGFLRVLSSWFINHWQGKLLNIHPSLLPALTGLRTHERVLQAGALIHGCTVHFATEVLDEGPIVAQAVVPVLNGDQVGPLAKRVLEMEHLIYPRALNCVAKRADGDPEIETFVMLHPSLRNAATKS